MNKICIGVIKETKTPPDTRVPLTPKQCRKLLDTYPSISIIVQPSDTRCFPNAAYEAENITLSDDLSNCDVLMGVKEVKIPYLLANKKYFFFSHTIKKQPYNKTLLQTILAKNIQLIDYECLRDEEDNRIIGFGRFAGIVGMHNGLLAYGKKTGAFDLPPAYDCEDYQAIKNIYSTITLPPIKVVITGQGRVAQGAKEVIDLFKVKEVSPEDYLTKTYNEAVYTCLPNNLLYQHKEKKTFERKEFFANPSTYESNFAPYSKVTDLMVNGIYWSPQAPIFFSKEAMKQSDFAIKVIADITCDIEGSIPATLRATEIGDAVLGYDAQSEKEVAPYQANTIDIMSVDNLPNELPKDASSMFSKVLVEQVIPELLQEKSALIDRASITKDGKLFGKYVYLTDYVA